MFCLTPGRDTMPNHFWYQLNGKSAMENYIEQTNNIKNGIISDPFFERICNAAANRETTEPEENYEVKLKSEIRIKK